MIKNSQITKLADATALRRLVWLQKQHPKMSARKCRLWIFGSATHQPGTEEGGS